MTCDSCGAKDALKLKFRFIKDENGERTYVGYCNKCSDLPNVVSLLRDANGDSIVWNDSLNGKFNYCLGEVVRSKAHLSEILKSNDMMQKGDFVNKKDKRMGYLNEHGRAHRGS